MLFPQRNPWVDPRVERVTPLDAQSYLERHGWRQIDYPRSEVLMYAGPVADDGQPITQIVPLVREARDYRTCMTMLIASVANLENRYAVEVLDEMLGVSAPSANGTANGKVAAKEFAPTT